MNFLLLLTRIDFYEFKFVSTTFLFMFQFQDSSLDLPVWDIPDFPFEVIVAITY